MVTSLCVKAFHPAPCQHDVYSTRAWPTHTWVPADAVCSAAELWQACCGSLTGAEQNITDMQRAWTPTKTMPWGALACPMTASSSETSW